MYLLTADHVASHPRQRDHERKTCHRLFSDELASVGRPQVTAISLAAPGQGNIIYKVTAVLKVNRCRTHSR